MFGFRVRGLDTHLRTHTRVLAVLSHTQPISFSLSLSLALSLSRSLSLSLSLARSLSLALSRARALSLSSSIAPPVSLPSCVDADIHALKTQILSHTLTHSHSHSHSLAHSPPLARALTVSEEQIKDIIILHTYMCACVSTVFQGVMYRCCKPFCVS